MNAGGKNFFPGKPGNMLNQGRQSPWAGRNIL